MRRADMFEHADRDDPVELARHMAVIDQLELYLVGDAAFLGAAAGNLQLLLRQRDAEHLGPGLLVEIQRHAAPAAADIEHGHARLQRELRGDMRLLVGLRLFRVFAGSVK